MEAIPRDKPIFYCSLLGYFKNRQGSGWSRLRLQQLSGQWWHYEDVLGSTNWPTTQTDLQLMSARTNEDQLKAAHPVRFML